jgi:hypothetical protein
VEDSDFPMTILFMFSMTPRESTSGAAALKLLPLAKMYNNPPVSFQVMQEE